MFGARAVWRSWGGEWGPGSEEGPCLGPAEGKERLGNSTRSLAVLPGHRKMEWSQGYWIPQRDLPQHQPRAGQAHAAVL